MATASDLHHLADGIIQQASHHRVGRPVHLLHKATTLHQ
jgi:hypothetical protein